MGVGFESQVFATCDVCGCDEFSSVRTLADFKRMLRVHGWTFGKKAICPECNERRKALRASMRRFKNGKVSDI